MNAEDARDADHRDGKHAELVIGFVHILLVCVFSLLSNEWMTNHSTTHHIEKPLIGSLLAIFAFLCLSLAGVFSKIETGKLPVMTIFFFQFFVPLLLFAPWVLRQGLWRVKTKRLGFHLARDVGGVTSYFLYLYSLHTVPLVNATLLLYASPIWVPLILLVWLKIKVQGKLWWGILIGFVGVLCILKPDGAEFVHVGTLFAVISGVIYAFTTVCVRLLLTSEPPERILFYLFLVGSLLTLPFVIVQWQPLTMHQFVVLVAAGLSMLGCQFAFTQCLRFINASTAAVFSYSGVVFSGLFGFIIWHHVPDRIALFGILFVVIGGVLTILIARKKK